MWIDEDNVDESGGRLARMARVAVGLALMAAFVGLVWTILKNAPTPGRHAIRSVTRVELPSPTPPPPRPPEPEKPIQPLNERQPALVEPAIQQPLKPPSQ